MQPRSPIKTLFLHRAAARTKTLKAALLVAFFSIAPITPAVAQDFRIEEATIAEMHTAIQQGKTSCEDVVRKYVDRIKSYNGSCTTLVTEDGQPVAPQTGYVRGGAPIQYSTQTIAADRFLPNLDQYTGKPLEYGHMGVSASDPSVMLQYGMVVGRPGAGKINALETINLRGERSVTCSGACDANPATGPLPGTCPAACESFRQQRDALEAAADMDRRFGSRPDLDAMPIYCATMAVKNWYDLKDMRSTGGNDVAYAKDFAPDDATVVDALRDKGAIILGVAIAGETSYQEDGPIQADRIMIGEGGNTRGTWGGEACNPYDTERTAGPSSAGSGAAVNANLVTCSICETTSGSCRIPANQNAVASIVATRGFVSEDGTATAQFINHRPGVMCRTIGDAARVMDALEHPERRNYDPKDPFTSVPKALLPEDSYSSFIYNKPAPGKDQEKTLRGVRIGLVREYMVKHSPNDVAISDRVDQEAKRVLRDILGAELVESYDPLYPEDPDVPNMTYTFQDALSEILPHAMPEYFAQKKGDVLEFSVPGYDVTTLQYMLDLSMGKAPLSEDLNLRRILRRLDDTGRTVFSMHKYLADRGDDRITDWKSYAANSTWRSEGRAARVANAAALDVHNILPTQGMDMVKVREVVRLVVAKVMYENDLDALIHPNVGIPLWKVGYDRGPTINERRPRGPAITDLLGVPEIIIPAGYNDIVYEPVYILSRDRTEYSLINTRIESTLNTPMPFSINFWGGPGDEGTLLKIASAYEAATNHRFPPADFGPVEDGGANQ